jgi:FkbM family methyltransferase
MPRVPPLVSAVAERLDRQRVLLRRAFTVRAPYAFARREARGAPAIARYRLRRSGLVVHVRHGTGDVAGLQEIFLARNYDPPAPIAALLERLAADHQLRAVDLGGNIGLFGLALFARFPGAQVVSFEPDAENARLLDLTRRANGRERDWELVEAAAGAAPGEVRFRSGRHMESHVVEQDEPGTIGVPQLDVFDWLAETDWLKIDVEGGEWAILADPRFATLEIPVLALEYHPHLCPVADPGGEITRLLTQAGYRIEPYRERGPGLGELWAWRDRPARGRIGS